MADRCNVSCFPTKMALSILELAASWLVVRMTKAMTALADIGLPLRVPNFLFARSSNFKAFVSLLVSSIPHAISKALWYSAFGVGCPDWIFAIGNRYNCDHRSGNVILAGKLQKEMARLPTVADILCGDVGQNSQGK